jgi:multiple sugar transport system permease protein
MTVTTIESTRQAARRRRFSWTPYLFIGLAVLYLLLFAVVPLLKGLDLSFTNTRILNPTAGRYIGLGNYDEVLGSGTFFKSVVATLIYTGFTVVGSVTLGTVSAFVINRLFPGRILARAIMVMPWAVPTVAVALVFRWIYNDSSGVANDASAVLGLGERGWLTDPNYGMLSVVLATIWKVTPFIMLVVLAALHSVPEDLYEATKIDGADAYSTFKLVVLPFLLPTLRVVALLMTIWSFRRFEIIWLLTGGGPVDVTTTIVIDVYRQAFNNSQLGLAAATGMLGLVLSLIVTAVYFVVEQRAAKQNGTNA